MPVDAKGVIEDTNAPFCLRMIELITLVLEDSSLAEHGKAVGETLWDKQLLPQLTIESLELTEEGLLSHRTLSERRTRRNNHERLRIRVAL